MLNYRSRSVMEEHNRKIAKVAQSKVSTKKKVEEVLRIFQESLRRLGGRRKT